MRVIQKAGNAGDRVVALGTFDGVHLGHRALLRTAKAYAREHGIPLRVCTFDRHPMEIIRPEDAPPLLTTIPEKARQLSGEGVDEMELIPFDRREAMTEPEDFLAVLRSMINVRAVVAGWNYTFGKMGRGNADLLAEDGKKHGYDVLIEPAATMADGTVISSSLVRRLLQDGNTGTAAEILGYDYAISGTVSPGKHEGHLLGFPTANVIPPARKALPAYGVYTCLLETQTDMLPAVVNIGIQPTLPSGIVTAEAHVLDGSPMLYGQRVRLTLRSMIRPERKFPSVEALQKQIRNDREEALRLFGMA